MHPVYDHSRSTIKYRPITPTRHEEKRKCLTVMILNSTSLLFFFNL